MQAVAAGRGAEFEAQMAASQDKHDLLEAASEALVVPVKVAPPADCHCRQDLTAADAEAEEEPDAADLTEWAETGSAVDDADPTSLLADCPAVPQVEMSPVEMPLGPGPFLQRAAEVATGPSAETDEGRSAVDRLPVTRSAQEAPSDGTARADRVDGTAMPQIAGGAPTRDDRLDPGPRREALRGTTPPVAADAASGPSPTRPLSSGDSTGQTRLPFLPGMVPGEVSPTRAVPVQTGLKLAIEGDPGQALTAAAFSQLSASHPWTGSHLSATPIAAPSFLALRSDGPCQQVSNAMLQMRDDQIEIALSPEELGSVRLILSRGESGASMTVWVERPEVLEMMRRNAETMLADLRHSGLINASLVFRDGMPGPDGGGGGGGWGAQREGPREAGIAVGVAAPAVGISIPPRAAFGGPDGGRLDIRV